MPLLSAATVAKLRAIALSAMTDTCTVIRPGATTYSGMGGTPGAPTETDYPCRVQVSSRASGSSRGTAGRVREESTFLLHLPHDSDVRNTDRIRLNGVEYGVTWAPPVGADAAERLVGVGDVS